MTLFTVAARSRSFIAANTFTSINSLLSVLQPFTSELFLSHSFNSGFLGERIYPIEEKGSRDTHVMKFGHLIGIGSCIPNQASGSAPLNLTHIQPCNLSIASFLNIHRALILKPSRRCQEKSPIIYIKMEADSPSTTSLPAYRIFRDKHGIPQFEPKRGTQALKDALIYAFPSLETELQLMQAALRKFFDSERGSKFVFELPQNDLQTSLAKPKNVEGEVSPIQFGKASLKSWKGNVGGRRGSRASSRASSRPPSRPPSRALSRVSSRTETRTETPITRPGTPLDLNSGGKMTTWILSNGQEVEGRKKQPYDPVKRRKVAENRGNACDKHRASKTTVSTCLEPPVSPFS